MVSDVRRTAPPSFAGWPHTLHAVAPDVPGAWLSPTHNSIVWCNQLVQPLSRFLTAAASAARRHPRRDADVSGGAAAVSHSLALARAVLIAASSNLLPAPAPDPSCSHAPGFSHVQRGADDGTSHESSPGSSGSCEAYSREWGLFASWVSPVTSFSSAAGLRSGHYARPVAVDEGAHHEGAAQLGAASSQPHPRPTHDPSSPLTPSSAPPKPSSHLSDTTTVLTATADEGCQWEAGCPSGPNLAWFQQYLSPTPVTPSRKLREAWAGRLRAAQHQHGLAGAKGDPGAGGSGPGGEGPPLLAGAAVWSQLLLRGAAGAAKVLQSVP
jgi:hypothetical protein